MKRVVIQTESHERQGGMLVLSAFALTMSMMFVAFSVDLGVISLTRTRLQNATDAAALAAAMEITSAVEDAGPDVSDVVAYAKQAARLKAVEVAALNGVFIDPDNDVFFGKRSFDHASGEFVITWDTEAANVVKVVARKDNDDPDAPDAKLKLMFAGTSGNKKATIRAEATAYVESRDIVAILDFSRSMNYDSYFNPTSMNHLETGAIEQNLQTVWDDLQPFSPGGMVFPPDHLSITKNDGDTEATVTFEYDEAVVECNEPLHEVKLEFNDGDRQTFSAGGLTGVFSRIGRDSDRDIERVWVTVISTEQNPVTLTGKKPKKNCEPQIEVTFSGDRQSVDVTSSKDLSNVVLRFSNGVEYKFDGLSGHNQTFAGTGSHAGLTIDRVWVKSGCNKSGDGPGYGERFIAPESSGSVEKTLSFTDNNTNVMEAFGLSNVNYPFPVGSWNSFINYARSDSSLYYAGYREMYGGLTYINYILENESGNWETPDLWMTRHYPFHAIKEGHHLLVDFVGELGFDDYVGLVSYDTYHRVEDSVTTPDGTVIDISTEPITNNYSAVRALMTYKQAAHYAYSTNVGGGIKEAKQLMDGYSRDGAQKTILLMTDGNTNTIDSGEDTSLPSDWSWNELLDYDGDGYRDYYTSSTQRRYVLKKAKEAVDSGITIHTMSVGVGADRSLMRAIAHLGKGQWIDVPGGTTVSEMESEVRDAFNRIAAYVPPARLLPND